ncbi:MAG: beta-lactamase family protein [Gemmatimonadota bacterium]|nr:beta-lactamase family protein [Gemmatimonadota bacterium]
MQRPGSPHGTHTVSRREWLATSLAAVALSACGQPRQVVVVSPQRIAGGDELESLALRTMEKYQIPGLSLAVVRDGRLRTQRSYGLNDMELGLKATDDTVYQLASVTKVFTSVAIGILVDEGAISLGASISEFLPGLPTGWSKVQLHHLLEHTSGLPSSTGANPRFGAEESLRRMRDRFVDEAKLDYFTAAERLEFLKELPLAFEPGAKWSYNQPGYMLLGMIIERVTKKPFEIFMRDRIFTPLSMRSARFGDSRVVVPGRRQVAYTRQFGPLQNWLWPYSTSDYPAAGLNATAGDVARLFIALGTALVKPGTLDRLWQQPLLASGTRPAYALGWTVGEVKGRKVVGHEGGGCAWIAHVPSERVTAIALCNLAGSGADMGAKVAELLIA